MTEHRKTDEENPGFDRLLDKYKVIKTRGTEGNDYMLRLWGHWMGTLTCKVKIEIKDLSRLGEIFSVDRRSMRVVSTWLAKACRVIDAHEDALATELQKLVEDKRSATPKE